MANQPLHSVPELPTKVADAASELLMKTARSLYSLAQRLQQPRAARGFRSREQDRSPRRARTAPVSADEPSIPNLPIG
jgi:hypothetical protein